MIDITDAEEIRLIPETWSTMVKEAKINELLKTKEWFLIYIGQISQEQQSNTQFVLVKVSKKTPVRPVTSV